MQIPFKAVSKQELEKMLGIFGWFQRPQKYRLLNANQAEPKYVFEYITRVLNNYNIEAPEIRYLLRGALRRG
jgi:hypothetical protein